MPHLLEVIEAGDPCFAAVIGSAIDGTGAELGVVGAAEDAAGEQQVHGAGGGIEAELTVEYPHWGVAVHGLAVAEAEYTPCIEVDQNLGEPGAVLDCSVDGQLNRLDRLGSAMGTDCEGAITT